jgi:hypothetical protein
MTIECKLENGWIDSTIFTDMPGAYANCGNTCHTAVLHVLALANKFEVLYYRAVTRERVLNTRKTKGGVAWEHRI